MQANFTFQSKHSGLSLIELMIAIVISSILMLGLTYTFKNSSDSSRELEKAGKLIENGRYAISLLTDDLHHAGYYGFYYDTSTAPAGLPDACDISNTTNLENALNMPLQGYTAPNYTTRANLTATSTCDDKNLIIAANLRPGSDILVLRRAETAVFTGNPITNDVYIQANSRDVNLLLGNSAANVPTDAADNAAQTMLKYPASGNTAWADTRKYRVHVYFVAPCSFGSGANEICTASDDSVPTLKRLELSSDGTNTEMNIVPLVEGVEYMKIQYGIDNSPATVNLTTGFAGDGNPDAYVAAPSLTQWPLVVAVKVDLLVRSPEPTSDYTDTKSYTLRGATIGPFNDNFKRHVYTTVARPMNLAGRREIPD